ncbi:MAG: P-type conjugative transfer protein VirB9 [Alphaproteobacteria bacterium]
MKKIFLIAFFLIALTSRFSVAQDADLEDLPTPPIETTPQKTDIKTDVKKPQKSKSAPNPILDEEESRNKKGALKPDLPQEPEAFGPDERIKRYIYNPNQVYVYTGYYTYQSFIQFASDEAIVNITLGDPRGWTISPNGSRLFIKPIGKDATTHMTVITDKRIYFFELYADFADEQLRDKNLSFAIYFHYPDLEPPGRAGSSFIKLADTGQKKKDDVEELLKTPQDLNFNYSITGSRKIAPLKIFDDGEFTYMEFRGVNATIPAIYSVDENRSESLINYRVQGRYIVIERVESQFTLRYGTEVACVFNEINQLPSREAIDQKNKKSLGKRAKEAIGL